jgi:hypothetical protein
MIGSNENCWGEHGYDIVSYGYIYLCTPCDIGTYFENRFFKDCGDGIMAFIWMMLINIWPHWNDWVQWKRFHIEWNFGLSEGFFCWNASSYFMDLIMQHLIACRFDSYRRRRSLVSIILFTLLKKQSSPMKQMETEMKTNSKLVLSSWEGCA